MADEIIIEGEMLEIDLPPHPVKNTIVTGIVKDRDGITWINCGWKAVLVGYVGAPPIYLQDGTRVQTSFGGTVAPDGTFTGTLPANDAMIPPKTKWRITFFPLAVSASSTFDLAVTGANQNINTIITQNIVPPRFKLIPGNFGYDDSEISPQPKAGTPSCSYLNTTTGNLRIWNGTNFVDVTTGALPTNAVQLAPHQNTGDVLLTGALTTAKVLVETTPAAGHVQFDLEPTFNRCRFISQTAAGNPALGQFEFSAADGISAYKSFLIIDNDTGAQFVVPLHSAGSIDAAGAYNFQQNCAVLGYDAALNIVQLVGRSNNASPATIRLSGLNADTGRNWTYIECKDDGIGNPVTHVAGTLTADTKAFLITHPLDAQRNLVHGCLEGAEFGVYYRGESRTDSKGLCTIELPAYFEALTALEGRTVLLTVIDTDVDGKNPIAMLAASRIKDGAFRVRSDIEFISFYWEVKATRKDIAPLEVEVLREKEAPDAATS